MKLSIIIPVYNEEKTIEKVLDKLLVMKLPCDKEIIIVDDGSTDKTKRVITRKKNSLIKTIFHKDNQGKGAAIQSGIKKATGNYIIIQDADLEYNPSDIPKLLAPILNQKDRSSVILACPESPERDPGRARSTLKMTKNIAVYGSRFMKDSATIPLLYLLGNKVLTMLTNMLYGVNLTDMETGYKLLPASFCKKSRFRSARFDIEPEITIKLIKKKIRIIEIPISYKGRTHLGGKKLTIKDAFGALKTLIYLRFFH